MVTIAIAAYAAVISTVAVGWQIYSWRRTHKTRMRVTLSNAVASLPLGFQRVVAVEALNDNDHAVRVTGWGIEANDGSGGNLFMVQPVAGSNMPGVIAPHDSGTGMQDWDALADAPINFKEPVVAFVKLASGEWFRSKPIKLAA